MKRFLPALFAGALLLFAFQNCARTDFGAASQDSSALTMSIKEFQPALAVSSTVCLNCHANLQGNLITNLDGASGSTHFLDSVGHGSDYTYTVFDSHGNESFLGTISVHGTIYVPPVLLTADAQSTAASIIATEKQNLSQIADFAAAFPANGSDPAPNAAGLLASTMAAPVRISEYINAILNGRTSQYRSFLANVPEANSGITNIPDTAVQEVSSLTIGAPSQAEIRAQITAGQPYTYFPTSTQTLLSGFHVSANGQFWQNDPSVPLVCDGDLFVDAPVALINLQLQTTNGCRIYATGTVFVQGSTSYNGGEAIAFVGGSSPNLQISSATGVSLGLGQCSAQGLPANAYAQMAGAKNSTLGGRMQIPYNRLDLLTPMWTDYQKINDANGNPILVDAGDCAGASAASRKVSFNHLLLNAPRVDSRYSGDFNGVIIAGFFMGSLGGVVYTYDNTFENVSILPRLNQGSIFAIQTCDQPSVVDQNLTTCK